MKKYIVLIGMILLSFSVQAEEKALMEGVTKKSDTQISRDDIHMNRKMGMEHRKEMYLRRYSRLSQSELEQNKQRLERMTKSGRADRREELQVELDVVNSLLGKTE